MLLFRFKFILIPALLVSCTPMLPQAELDAYLIGYTKVQDATNSVLDLMTPFEREVIRSLSSIEISTSPAVDTSLLVISTDEAESQGLSDCPTGKNNYCYQYRDAYATIGDPPLVKSVRRTSNVLFRFNKLLAAYAAGASAEILEADFASLQADVGVLGMVAKESVPGIGQAIEIAKMLAKPLVASADRAQFGVYLKENHADVDKALGLLAESSEVLYSNVKLATQIRRRAVNTSSVESKALVKQGEDMRRILANWSVLIDDVRVQLSELAVAAEHPENFETGLRNLGKIDIEMMTNTEILNRELLSLIGNVLSNQNK